MTQRFGCLGLDFSARGPTSSKQIVLLGLYEGLRNVHEIRVAGPIVDADPRRWRFNHYNANASQLKWLHKQRLVDAPALDAFDDGMRRYADVVAGCGAVLPEREGAGPAGPTAGHSRGGVDC